MKNKRNDGGRYERKVATHMKWNWFWHVRVCGKSGDYGADIMARDFLLRRVVVQCKNYDNPVGVKAVQEVIAAKAYYNAKRAIVATNSTFTKQAKTMASKCKVELWEKCCV